MTRVGLRRAVPDTPGLDRGTEAEIEPISEVRGACARFREQATADQALALGLAARGDEVVELDRRDIVSAARGQSGDDEDAVHGSERTAGRANRDTLGPMRRAAWVLVGVMACSGGKPAVAPQPELGAAAHDPSGAYWCTIDAEKFENNRFACVIKRVGERIVLGKLGGSERLRGVVTPTADGFSFTGEVYCRWIKCTRPLRGTFAPAGRGEYRGTFPDDAMIVRLMPAPDGAFGGAGYGGDGYGDPFGYGGPASAGR